MKETDLVRRACASILPGAVDSISILAHGFFPIYRVEHSGRTLAVKIARPAAMGRCELFGLRTIEKTGCRVPAPLGIYEEKDTSVLLLECIRAGRARPEDLIQQLKILYSEKSESWGLDHDNYIGALLQKNSRHRQFAEFWWVDRIEPQITLAVSKGMLPDSLPAELESLTVRLSDSWKLDSQKPRLIHGDLWSGNVLGAEDGCCYLIDPSIAYGNPEQDLAMLDLFGSVLDRGSVREICRAAGMPDGYAERRSFWQIYPLLVHVNLFGRGYVGQVMSAIRSYQ